MSINRKGIVLAGGTGSRLYPITMGVSKQLLPVFDKPMIYYPISVLMLAGIDDILIISSPQDIGSYKRLLGDGKQFGVDFTYIVQEEPGGIAQAFIVGEEFIKGFNVALILGDNVFYGQNFSKLLSQACLREEGATVFGYHVSNPDQFGIIEIDNNNKILSIEEKPTNPKSNYALTGLYFYDEEIIEISKSLEPSQRGELEITDVNLEYLIRKKLNVELLGRGFAWLDTGTHESLLDAGMFVQTIEERQGLKVACLEEIAFNNNWINKIELENRADIFQKTSYGNYLRNLLESLK